MNDKLFSKMMKLVYTCFSIICASILFHNLMIYGISRLRFSVLFVAVYVCVWMDMCLKASFCSFNLHFCYYRQSWGSFPICWTFGFPFLLNTCSSIFAHLSVLFSLYFLLIFRNSLNVSGKRPLLHMMEMYFPAMSVFSFSLWCS